MDLKQLKYFLMIAEEAQITSAAERLHMAQPPLSQQLKALENELGIQLFERKPRRLELTDAGHFLRHRASQILDLVEITTSEMEAFTEGLQGSLRIGTVSSSGANLLDERFMRFHNDHSQVTFEIFEGNSYQIVEFLDRRIVELGIIRTPFENTDFFQCSRAKESMVAVASTPDFFDTKDEIIPISQLHGKSIIINRRYISLLTEVCQEENIKLNFVCRNNDARTTLWWAYSGFGIGLIPKSTLMLGHYENMTIKELDHPRLFTQLSAIWSKKHPISKIGKKFLEYFASPDSLIP